MIAQLAFAVLGFTLLQGGVDPQSAGELQDAAGGLRTVDPELTSGEELDLVKELVRMMTILAVLLVGLILAVKLMPGWLRARASGPGLIEVVEKHPLEGRRSLVLVKVGDEYVLIGSSERGLSKLSGGELDSAQLDALRRKLGRSARPDDDETPFQEALRAPREGETTPEERQA